MITETNTKEIYDITGLTPLAGGYEFTFPYTSAQDVRVYTTGNRTDTEVSTSNYTIDKSGATPKVVFIAGYNFPAGQTKLTIIRSVSYSQELDLRNGDLIDADKLEGALDDITQQIQQVAEKVDRAILSSVSDTAPLSIPEASQRNNMLLGFDSEGKVIPVLTTDIEQKLAQALAAEESAIIAKNAAENAQHEAESAQSAAETAQGKAETAQAVAESAETSSQTLLASIKTKTEESIDSINTAKTGAVGAVTTQQATSVAAVQEAQNTAESDIAGKRASALTAIDTAKTAAVAAVNTQKETSVAAADREIIAKRDSALIDIQTARTNAVNAITTQKDTSLQEIEQLASERKSEINSLAANQKADVKQYTDGVVASAKTEIDTEKTKAVTAVQEEGDAEVTRVQSVYQTDLNKIKGDLSDIENNVSNSVIKQSDFIYKDEIINGSGGNDTVSGFDSTGYISVDCSTDYYFLMAEGGLVVAEYTSDSLSGYIANSKKVFSTTEGKFTTGETTTHIRISTYASIISDFIYLSKGEECKVYGKDAYEILNSPIFDNELSTVNRICKVTMGGYYVSNTGSFVSNSEYGYSDIIALPNVSKVTVTKGTSFVCWYDETKNIIPTTPSAYSKLTVLKVPSNAKYIRVCFSDTYEKYQSGVIGLFFGEHYERKEYHVGSNQEYITIRSAVEDAFNTQDAMIYIHPGTYDLTSEYSDKIESHTGDAGLYLGKGMHLVFYDGAKVTALFDPNTYSDEILKWAKIYFQPIYAHTSDFTIENMEIEASNTRYCVHDELAGTGVYCHKYINCRMKYTEDKIIDDISLRQCIGGGLGKNGTIVIDGGYYQSIPIESNIQNGQVCISFHNGNNGNCDSSIFIKNVYLADRGFFRFGYYGSSTKKSNVQISGCSMGLPTIVKPETEQSTNENFNVIEFCNEIRNNS